MTGRQHTACPGTLFIGGFGCPSTVGTPTGMAGLEAAVKAHWEAVEVAGQPSGG